MFVSRSIRVLALKHVPTLSPFYFQTCIAATSSSNCFRHFSDPPKDVTKTSDNKDKAVAKKQNGPPPKELPKKQFPIGRDTEGPFVVVDGNTIKMGEESHPELGLDVDRDIWQDGGILTGEIAKSYEMKRDEWEKGPNFKRTTGYTDLPVIRNARDVLLGLYKKTIMELESSGIPESSRFYENIKRITEFRNEAVHNTRINAEFEEIINNGQAEELILQARDSIILIRRMTLAQCWEMEEKPKLIIDDVDYDWEYLEDEYQKAF